MRCKRGLTPASSFPQKLFATGGAEPPGLALVHRIEGKEREREGAGSIHDSETDGSDTDMSDGGSCVGS